MSLVAAGLLAGALGVIFMVLGLEQADQMASVVGVFVGLAGLTASVYGVMLARRGHTPRPAPQLGSPQPSAASPEGGITASGERSAAVRDNSGVIQTGDDSTAQR